MKTTYKVVDGKLQVVDKTEKPLFVCEFTPPEEVKLVSIAILTRHPDCWYISENPEQSFSA